MKFPSCAAALAALLVALTPGPAFSHGRHGHHHHHGRVGVHLGIGFGYYGPWYYPGYVVVPAAPVVYSAPVEPAVPLAPAPVIAPQQGQSPQQTEFDVQQCNRWAMTQPDAIADAGVFHRRAMDCVRSLGYAVK